MRHDRISSGRVVRARGVASDGFPASAVTVPANSEASILLDTGRVLAAYPALVVSGGRGARVSVSYVEALYDPNAKSTDPNGPSRVRFANRAAVQDGLALGLTDTFKPDGAAQRRFEPFWWRTWRFAEIKVTTAAEPLTLHDFETWDTGYPFKERGGRLNHTYSFLGVETYKQTSTEAIPSGDVTVKMLFEADEHKPGSGGRVTLWADDTQIGEGRMPRTVPVAFSSYAGMDVGRDNGLVVDRAYEERAPYAFTGTVRKVAFDLEPARHEKEQALHEHAAMQSVGQGAAG
jgi:hypothetical protein